MTNVWTITPVEWEQKKKIKNLNLKKKSKPLPPKKTKLWLGCGKLKWGKQKVNTTKLFVKVGPDMALKKKTKKPPPSKKKKTKTNNNKKKTSLSLCNLFKFKKIVNFALL